MLTRRGFICSAAATALGFRGLRHVFAAEDLTSAASNSESPGSYGELKDDPYGFIDLPTGFSYRVVSKVGERMDDGLFVPAQHDGMGAFPGPRGTTILIRNHELDATDPRQGPFGWTNELLPRTDRARIYDSGRGDRPLLGGTTTLVYDTGARRLEKHFLSLTGTVRNCAGGATPWNSWISCEESVVLADGTRQRDHGYNFEVPAVSRPGLADPVPLRDMGRFTHEAVAVDPRSGIVYQTEDRNDGLIYRFVPRRPGRLADGGRLEALVIRDGSGLDTRNWPDAAGRQVEVGRPMPTTWVPIDNVESPDDDLRHAGFSQGAARFARGEGMWYGRDSIYFACTNGGPARLGQIWRYQPGDAEHNQDTRDRFGSLELFIESTDSSILENADNLTVAPWGDLFVCEDGPNDNHLLQITSDGRILKFARNHLTNDELAGATFSPDGTTLFVNLQGLGVTLAIRGPWRTIHGKLG